MHFDLASHTIVGEHGSLIVPADDAVARKLFMLVEGECQGLGPNQAAAKYGFSRQRYFQVRNAFRDGGTAALVGKTRGPKTQYRRTDELQRQVIRHLFLDPKATVQVIGQKLRQTGFIISDRSVQRVISDYGLQKKTLSMYA